MAESEIDPIRCTRPNACETIIKELMQSKLRASQFSSVGK